MNCQVSQRPGLRLDPEKSQSIVYTYSVSWEESDVPWATRWDNYLHIFEPNIHWTSLINSTIIVFALTGVIASILLKTLRRDILRYNSLDEEDDTQEDYGWKLVYADVFRSPKLSNLFSVFLGSGAQLCFMVAITLSRLIFIIDGI